LNILDFVWFWPINNGLNFGLVHEKSIRSEDVSEVFHGGLVKFALVGICIEAVFLEYADQLEDADKTVHYLKQQVMILEQEIGKGDYKESCQQKMARYNAPTEETSMNTSNNEQVPAVRAPQNYSQVLQAPAPTHIQMDVDKEGSRMGQFPALPKPQLPWETMASMVTILCGVNWTPTREPRPTMGL